MSLFQSVYFVVARPLGWKLRRSGATEMFEVSSIHDSREAAEEAYDLLPTRPGFSIELHTMEMNKPNPHVRQLLMAKASPSDHRQRLGDDSEEAYEDEVDDTNTGDGDDDEEDVYKSDSIVLGSKPESIDDDNDEAADDKRSIDGVLAKRPVDDKTTESSEFFGAAETEDDDKPSLRRLRVNVSSAAEDAFAILEEKYLLNDKRCVSPFELEDATKKRKVVPLD